MGTLEAFLAAPSVALLAALNIKQLHSVVKHYKIDATLPRGAKKHELLDFIRACLVDKNIRHLWLYRLLKRRFIDVSKQLC